jgi:hypothetical protein
MNTIKNLHNQFSKIVVQKPWGYEYLIFETKEVALWLLYIEHGKGTSLHCHPMKTTGLILLEGEAELGFIVDSKVIQAPNKQMIRRGLFHSTRALSLSGALVLEIETPNDKEDLVRLEDNYGRASDGYESKQNWVPRNENHIWIEKPKVNKSNEYLINKTVITVSLVTELSEIQELGDEEIVMFLQGGIGKQVGKRNHLATVPGDIGKGSVLKKVARQMEYCVPETLILRV